MILADKIMTLRKQNGWSQEELAEMLGVSRQAISKWESAQSIPDMNRILAMATIFGVTTDYLLRDDQGEVAITEPTAGAEDTLLRTVTMEEATDFLEHRNRSARRVPLGVFLCILSPIVLLFLGAGAEYGRLALSEDQATAIGLVVLLLFVAPAVALFILTGLAGSRFEYLEKEAIDTVYGVSGMVKERRERFRPVYQTQLIIGIILCILSCLPLFFAMFFFAEDEFAEALSIPFMLCLIAVGVFLIVRACIIWGGFQILLEEGDYSRVEKSDAKKMAPISGIYWSLVTAIFLGYSFFTNHWDRSWIIWPVAGVAYGVIYGIMRAMKRKG